MNNIQPNWLAPPGPRSRRVVKQRELAKRVVEKQPSAEQTRDAQRSQWSHSLCKQWTVGVIALEFVEALGTRSWSPES